MPTVYKTIDVDVEIDLDDFNDDDLINELTTRGHDFSEAEATPFGQVVKQRLDDIYHRRRAGRDYQEQLDQLIYEVLGRMS